jgi:hypothetical protein
MIPPSPAQTTTAAQAAAATTVAVAPQKVAKYEDAIKLIEAAQAAADVKVKDEALSKLLSFFRDRIARNSSREETDGAAAVKRAILGSRAYGHKDVAPST